MSLYFHGLDKRFGFSAVLSDGGTARYCSVVCPCNSSYSQKNWIYANKTHRHAYTQARKQLGAIVVFNDAAAQEETQHSSLSSRHDLGNVARESICILSDHKKKVFGLYYDRTRSRKSHSRSQKAHTRQRSVLPLLTMKPKRRGKKISTPVSRSVNLSKQTKGQKGS